MKKKPLILLITIIGLLTACKPTENNYRLAYELAQQRAQENLEVGELELMQEQQLPGYIRGVNDSIRAVTAHIMWQWSPETVDSGKRVNPMKYNLTVGAYRMLTNAKGQAETLASQGWPAVVMRAAGLPFLNTAGTGIANSNATTYYVIAQRSDNLDSIAAASRRFLKNNSVVGLPMPIAVVRR